MAAGNGRLVTDRKLNATTYLITTKDYSRKQAENDNQTTELNCVKVVKLDQTSKLSVSDACPSNQISDNLQMSKQN